MKRCRVCCWGLALVWMTTWGPPLGAASKKNSSRHRDDDAPSQKAEKQPADSHVVKRGETLWGIARKYEVSVGEMMDLNHMPNDAVHEGQVLKIPKPWEDAPPDEAPQPAESQIYVVAKGDSFRSIARALGISGDELEHANPKVDPDRLKIGAKLKIPPRPAGDAKDSKANAPTTEKAPGYVVRDKDTFYSIAKEHGLTTTAIAKANPSVVPEKLRPGMTLVLPTALHAKKDVGRDAGADTDPGQKTYAPKPGMHHYIISHSESAQSIADAFGISLKRLCEINGKKSAAGFQEGDEIMVPNR